MRTKIAVVVSGFPRRSETFALGELLALQQRGLLGRIYATKAGDGAPPQPGSESLAASVVWLPDGDAEAQSRALVRDAGSLELTGVHAYFAHRPSEVAAGAADRLGIPWGFSTHAKDARKVSRDELALRGRQAACVIACNRDVAKELKSAGVEARLVPHGVDTIRFSPSAPPSELPLRILAVGRLVEKKGFHDLISAAARIRLSLRLRIVGSGPERGELEGLARTLGVERMVEFAGAKTHAELPAEYRAAHIVAVPSVVDRSGDRDGLPNVVLEAMASGVPVVTTTTGDIASAIDASCGVLVPAGDVDWLARALDTLGRDPETRRELGQRARERVERRWNLEECGREFCRVLKATYER